MPVVHLVGPDWEVFGDMGTVVLESQLYLYWFGVDAFYLECIGPDQAVETAIHQVFLDVFWISCHWMG
jgi:hypothetical protein